MNSLLRACGFTAPFGSGGESRDVGSPVSAAELLDRLIHTVKPLRLNCLRSWGIIPLISVIGTQSGVAQVSKHITPRLCLAETWSAEIPESFDIDGAHVAHEGTILLWSRRKPQLLVARQGEPVSVAELAPRLSRLLAASFVDEETISVLGESGVEVSLARQTLDPIAVSDPGHWPALERYAPVHGAIRHERGWLVVGSLAPDRGLQVLRLVRDGRGTVLRLATAQMNLDSPLHVSGAARDLLLTSLAPPYSAYRLPIGSGSGSARSLTPLMQFPSEEMPLAKGRSMAEGLDNYWVSLPTLELDRGALQTLADLRTDRRILVLRDGTGDVIRNVAIDAAVGFVASHVTTRSLVAVRHLERKEVALYEWSWSGSEDPCDSELAKEQ